MMFLFSASDAGGARQLQPVIEEAHRRRIPCHILASAVTEPIFSDANIDAEILDLKSQALAKEVLQAQEAKVVLLGTTGNIKNEHYLTAAARELGIPSLAIVDEWYNYAQRFIDEKGELGTYLPDILCVQDEISQSRAIEEKIPKDILRITGSPALAALTAQAHAYAKNPPEVPEILSCGDRPSVLFLSQPLKVVYGAGPGERGTHGTFIGYHEDIVRSDLADILSTIGKDVYVLEKMHPLEEIKDVPSHADNVEWNVHTGTHDLWSILWHADVVVGMSTNALLEAAILGRTPISYQPNAIDPSLCTTVRLGLALLHTSKASLSQELPALMQKDSQRERKIPTLPFAPPDATSRVLDVVESITNFSGESLWGIGGDKMQNSK